MTNTVSARQWRSELLKRTTLTEDEIGEYSGLVKQVRPVTIATYQILTARRGGVYTHLALLDALDWGLVIYDEVHLLPAPVFKLTAELQARRRLGLTATLVREDGREGDVFSLIGPSGSTRPGKRSRRRASSRRPPATRCASTCPRRSGSSTRPPPTTSATARGDRAGQARRRPRARRQARGRAHPRDRPVSRPDRRARRGARRTEAHGRDPRRRARAAVPGVPRRDHPGARGLEGANFSVDLPEASVAIQVSGSFGSRQEEAQRLGRLLRPKESGLPANFYTLVARDTVDQDFAQNRQRFLAEQGYSYTILDTDDLAA